MDIGIIATHSFPIPTPHHTGDIVILDLAKSLDDLGHDVTVYAPLGTEPPSRDIKIKWMPMSRGRIYPTATECEEDCFDIHEESLRCHDIIHDFSITKWISDKIGHIKSVCTPMGGMWAYPVHAMNVCVWSKAMRDRGMRGATDYENCPPPDMGGPPQRAIKDAHVVYGGVDTGWYTPRMNKGLYDYSEKSSAPFLWLNRWHPAKGPHVAVSLARETGIELVMAGEDPAVITDDLQQRTLADLMLQARDAPNIHFVFLPTDYDGHHNQKRTMYQRAKALLYTVQFQEPFGLSQAEVMACGTPIIGTNFGSVPEVVSDGQTGFVVPSKITALAEAVQKVGQIDPVKCRDEAVKRFDRSVMAKNYVVEYENVLNGRHWG